MAGEVVYRLLQGEGIQIQEDSATKTVTISVPGLAGKINTGDIVQATQVQMGIAEIATNAEVQAGTDPDRIVTPAGLAAAAQSSLTDATAARLMRVGAFGLGGNVAVLNGQDLNTDRPSGLYYFQSTPVNSPTGNVFVLHERLIGDQHAYQIATKTNGQIFIRAQANGTWGAWREVYHTGNFDPNTKANTSGTYAGLSVGNAAQLNGQTDAMLTPPGMIAHFARETAPNGWLKANGAAVSRSTYANLFAAIGTRYGAGNGSSTFNLPDLRGYFHRSWDDGRGLDAGRAFGSSQSSQNLSHSHVMNPNGTHTHSASTGAAGTHSHLVYGVDNDASIGNLNQDVVAELQNPGTSLARWTRRTSDDGSHSHTVSVTSGGSHTHSMAASGITEARPENFALLACIKY